jgi:hypothetical protein
MALSATGQRRRKQMYAIGAALRDLLPKQCSLGEAAAELGITRQAASRMECYALAKLFVKAREKGREAFEL